MIRKTFQKISSFLLRSHQYLERRTKEGNPVIPYILKYQPSKSNKKIVHFNGNFVIGGTSQLIADIVERTSHKYFHHIIVPSHPRPLPYQPVSISEFPVSQVHQLYKWLAKERPALVHIHYWIRPMHSYYDFGIWYAVIFKICEELGLKVIQNINVPTQPFPCPAIVHNVFVSNYVRDEFNSLPDIPSSVIYPGSDFAHFTCREDHSFPANTIGMVYRLDRDKLNEGAIEVFIKAVKKKRSIVCYIIGGGFYLDYYKQRVKEEGLKKNFIFTGFVSYQSLPGYYKKIGLIVAPVHDESFGQVTPFAMSMGLPVAGYDTGALPEILDSTETLVKYGDTQALVDVIIDLINDTATCLRIGRINREIAQKKFAIEKMIGEYEKLYEMYAS